MPRYIYKCKDCDDVFEVSHSMSHEQRECLLCGLEDTIEKIPAQILKRLVSSERKPGDVVKKFIRDASVDLKNDKKEARREQK